MPGEDDDENKVEEEDVGIDDGEDDDVLATTDVKLRPFDDAIISATSRFTIWTYDGRNLPTSFVVRCSPAHVGLGYALSQCNLSRA